MKKIVLFLSASFLVLGVSSCNSDDDSNLQPKTFEVEANAKSIDELGTIGSTKIQSTTSSLSTKEDDFSEEVDTDREKTFPCKGWDCIQITD